MTEPATTASEPKLVCLGLGYSARAIAAGLADRGWSLAGTTTTVAGRQRIEAAGITGIVFDGSAPSTALADALRSATHIVVSIPPDATGDPVLCHHISDLVDAPRLVWIGYLSTVGVYGDRAGGWVDETDAPRPASVRSRQRVDAERAWLSLATAHRRVIVFRLAGIYGPGRSAIDSLRAGTARRIIKPGQVFNRIHVEDIARMVIAAIDRRGSHDVYNLSDDEPAPPQDVVEHAARLIGMPVPPDLPYDTAELSPMARSFYAECKRVRGERVQQDLGVALAYPTYREGLAAIARRDG